MAKTKTSDSGKLRPLCITKTQPPKNSEPFISWKLRLPKNSDPSVSRKLRAWKTQFPPYHGNSDPPKPLLQLSCSLMYLRNNTTALTWLPLAGGLLATFHGKQNLHRGKTTHLCSCYRLDTRNQNPPIRAQIFWPHSHFIEKCSKVAADLTTSKGLNMNTTFKFQTSHVSIATCLPCWKSYPYSISYSYALSWIVIM